MQETAGRRKNILVVEDEYVIGLFIRDALEDAGFVVELAATAAEARRHFHAGAADLQAAVIDVGLPDRPGDELAGELRRERPDLPIIIATAFSETVVNRRFACDPKLRALGKPYDSPALLSALATFGVSPA